MEKDPRRWIVALRASQDRLSSLVGSLGSDRVEEPSLAGQWTIAQVLSHLGSQAEIFGTILAAALDHRDPPGQETFPPIWDAWNARTPVEQVTMSLATNEVFVRELEALSDVQLSGLDFVLFGMELDAARFLQMRLSEHAVHSWDVAAALDPTATVLAAAVDLLVDALPGLARQVGRPQKGAFRVRILSSDPVRDLVLAVDDNVRIEPWDGGTANGTLRLPAEAWVRLVYGRLDRTPAPLIDLHSDTVTLETLRQVFPGF